MKVSVRLDKLRLLMSENGISACILPSSDPHGSEYLADHWQTRAWFSGFTGSAGLLVVETEQAGLFTDTRYYLQAEKQLQDSGIELFKLDIQPDYITWLTQQLKQGDVVAVWGEDIAEGEYNKLNSKLADSGIRMISDFDFITPIWTDRPAIPQTQTFVHELAFTGASVDEKLAAVRNQMNIKKAEYQLFTALDEIAWLFNIRGNDVMYNPVSVAYAVVGLNDAMLFIEQQKLTSNAKEMLENAGVSVLKYNDVYTFVANLKQSVLFDVAKTNHRIVSALRPGIKRITAISSVSELKACKSVHEIEQIKQIMVDDGVAMVRFLQWLEIAVSNEMVTEISAAAKLHEFRRMSELFMGDSFNAISSYKEHGAIVHYSPTIETDSALRADGIYLIDSGGQYLGGTTDITRTISLGNVKSVERLHFTLVLIGNINLAMAMFPEGTRGYQLDILARKALWEYGLNYGHGTGHGVGYFLNVHEGPQSISPRLIDYPIKKGMLISNEPAFYVEGKYGIRTENLMVVVEAEETAHGKFLEFETVTLCPIDTQLIDRDLLSDAHRSWLNSYHSKVFDELAPKLTEIEREWLEIKTAAI